MQKGVAEEVVCECVAAEELLPVEGVDERPDRHADEQPADEDLEQEAALALPGLRDEDAGEERRARAEQHSRRAAGHGERDRSREGDRECGEKSVHTTESRVLILPRSIQ